MDSSALTEIKEIQEIELEILKKVSEFCQKNDINFYLGEGTLLGAIRHKGFIPWDDDVDIMMKRKDYNKFLQLAPEGLKEDCIIQHSSLTKNYWSPFIKVRRKNETSPYYQKDIEHLTQENGPLIDIFPMVYIKNNIIDKYRIRYFRFWRAVLFARLKIKKKNNAKNTIAVIVSKFVKTSTIHQLLEGVIDRYSSEELEYLGMIATYQEPHKQIHKASDFSEAVWLDFEDAIMPVPNGYHKVLTKIYGEYMLLPENEHRVSKHQFVRRLS